MPYRHTGIRSLCFAAAAAAAAIHSTTTATSFNVHSALKSIGGAAAVANSEVCEERAVCGRRRCHSTTTTATATVCVSACAEAKVTAGGVRKRPERSEVIQLGQQRVRAWSSWAAALVAAAAVLARTNAFILLLPGQKTLSGWPIGGRELAGADDDRDNERGRRRSSPSTRLNPPPPPPHRFCRIFCYFVNSPQEVWPLSATTSHSHVICVRTKAVAVVGSSAAASASAILAAINQLGGGQRRRLQRRRRRRRR